MVPMYEISRDELRKHVKKANDYAVMLASSPEEFDRAARFAAAEIKATGDGKFWIKLAQELVRDPETRKEKLEVEKEQTARREMGQGLLI